MTQEEIDAAVARAKRALVEPVASDCLGELANAVVKMAEDRKTQAREHLHQIAGWEMSYQEQQKRIQELETQLADANEQAEFQLKQCSDAHQLLQTQGVEMRKLEQQLATARKLVEELTRECRERNANDRNNQTPEGLLVEADQFLKETEER